MIDNLNIKECSAKNFLCFGPKGIRFIFSAMSKIILIRGLNLDIDPDNEEERKASNGTGKSSVAEIIVYTLFGKTIKHPSKIAQEDVINNQANKKGLETEVLFGDYRVVRKRGTTSSLRVWKSAEGIWDKDTDISRDGIPSTQRLIEEIIGYTYETFSNILVFTDNNMGCFLECTGPKKREIVENLLGLDVYRNFSVNASKMRNLAKETIKDKHRTLELTVAEYESSKRRIKTVEDQEKIWKQTKENELNALVAKFKAKQAELGSTDIGPALTQYQEAQENIKILQNDLPIKEEKLKLLKEATEEARQKYEVVRKSRDALSITVRQINLDIMQTKNVIKTNTQMIDNLEEQRCKNCNFVDADALERCNKIIETENANLTKYESQLLKESEELTKYDNNINQLVDVIKIGDNRSRDLTNDIDVIRKHIINLSKIEKPETTAKEKVLEEQLNELKNQLLSKKDEVDGPSPFIKILESTINESELKEKECEAKRLELDAANNELPYYEFWVEAFGEKGIRKFVIDGVIDQLNDRIAHWLQFLIDGKITLTFDNQLVETIHRNPPDGDKFVYYAMSGGERRRLNLAVSQAFAHIMMLGRYPSLVFLDEVTTNIDPIGVQGVYNMITELSKERQVFVTTHDQDLLEMLSGCETINLVKQGGFTTIKN